MITTNCITGTLDPYVPSAEKPWTQVRAAHLFRRMGFGANLSELNSALAQNPSDLVDSIINAALSKPSTPMPEWGDWSLSDYDEDTIQEQAIQQVYEWITQWMEEMVKPNNFREKLIFFWHNHFVTRLNDYNCPSYMYQYHKVLETHALGNFKALTTAMGVNPAMLFFLNGVQNTRFQPNENYARELYELFTLGEGNGYTQEDIEETARALTGWNGVSEACAAIDFVPSFHDPGQKTIFGKTANWGYGGVHENLFTERKDAIAKHICTKIYTYFVLPEVDEAIVDQLATILKDNNFELEPVFRTLFKSEHFFDQASINTIIKGPLEMMLGYVREINVPYALYFRTELGYNELFLSIYFQAANLGQQLYNPVNVAGWPGNRAWMNSTSLPGRWAISDSFVYFGYEDFKDVYINFAKDISNNANDPALITQLIIDYFIPGGLQSPAYYEQATMVFKAGIPENYFMDGSWNLDWEEETVAAQVAFLIQHISRLPEYQLL